MIRSASEDGGRIDTSAETHLSAQGVERGERRELGRSHESCSRAGQGLEGLPGDCAQLVTPSLQPGLPS